MRYAAITCLLVLVLSVGSLQAKPIVSDLSIRSVDIDHSFKGLDILMFGARNDVGKIIVLLKGPQKRYVVRKKERVFGIWVNRRTIEFDDVFSSYSMATTTELDRFKNQQLLKNYNVGLDNLPFRLVNEEQVQESELTDFRNALIKYKQDLGLYPVDYEPVSFWGETLFRTYLPFAKHIDGGWHTAETILVNDNSVKSIQVTPIEVKKIGLEAFIFKLAHQSAAAYGILCVLMAIFAGWFGRAIVGRFR